MKGNPPDDWDSMPFGKLAALLRYRGLDAEAWLDAHRRNLEQLMAARATVLKGVEDVSASQLDATRAMLDRLIAEMPDLAQSGRYDDMARLHTEMAAKMLDAMMANMRGLSAVITRGNLDVLQVMGSVMQQAFKTMNQKK
jgi:hypothetical protein